MKLYEIDMAILKLIDEETGELRDYKEFEALEMERDAKISNIGCWIKDLKAEAEAIKAEKMNLDRRQKAAENQAERLKDFLVTYLNGAKFKDARVSISYRTSHPVEIDDDLDLNRLPDKYKKVTIEPNKTAIKEALDDSVIIPGCRLAEKIHIQIR